MPFNWRAASSDGPLADTALLYTAEPDWRRERLERRARFVLRALPGSLGELLCARSLLLVRRRVPEGENAASLSRRRVSGECAFPGKLPRNARRFIRVATPTTESADSHDSAPSGAARLFKPSPACSSWFAGKSSVHRPSLSLFHRVAKFQRALSSRRRQQSWQRRGRRSRFESAAGLVLSRHVTHL